VRNHHPRLAVESAASSLTINEPSEARFEPVLPRPRFETLAFGTGARRR
jgi:hypothetical protein